MAKKAAKKAPAKKPAAKPAKAPAAKGAGKSGGKGGGGGKGGVFPVSTGAGATPEQAGKTLVRWFNEGKRHEIEDFYWTPDIVSVEGMGVSMEWRGLQAVRAKNAEWMKDHRIHAAKAEALYVGATGFAVKFSMDVETISTGKREKMDEVGVYTIRDGKICREEFMYHAG